MKAPAAESPANRRRQTTGGFDEAEGANALDSETSPGSVRFVSGSESASVPGEIDDAMAFSFSHSPR